VTADYKGGDYHAGTFTAHRDNDPCHPNIGGRTNGEIRELYNRFKL
jgi:hypothetical protein